MEGAQRTYLPAFDHEWLLPLYDLVTQWLGVESAHRQLLDQADIQPGHRVLEIGCGTANLAILAKRLHPKADIIGLDPDPKALARSRRKAERKALSIQLDRGFSDVLPYPDGSFDRVLSALMFHHLLSLDDKIKTLCEVRRVLRPGGSLHLLDLAGGMPTSGGRLARLLHRNHLHRTEHVQNHSGEPSLPTLMGEAGFEGPAEVAHRFLTTGGRVAYYQAFAPHLRQEVPSCCANQ
jgi:ubiquinone/menaquinone biosynthesis C-methylase UbiE